MSALLPLLVAVLTFAVATAALNRRETVDVRRRVAAHVEPRLVLVPAESDEGSRLSRLRRPLALADERLRRLPGWTRLDALVTRSSLPLTTAQLAAATTGGVVLVALLGLAAGASPAAVLVLDLLAVGLLRAFLALRVSRRRRAFEDQLPELLSSLGSALRAGHGLNQALAAVAADAPEPASSEIGRVLAEARLGRPIEDALGDLGGRIGSQDLDFVLDAIVIQRQVGGSLAGIFELVGESVRQRQQFALRMRALTAMGRTSGLVLVALPFGLALVLSVLNRGYLNPLLTTGEGHLMLAVGAVLMAAGALWLKTIVSTR